MVHQSLYPRLKRLTRAGFWQKEGEGIYHGPAGIFEQEPTVLN